MTQRINVWSSPRNLSTALMYSWRQRADTEVVDEPLYSHYLTVTGLDHPARAETLASQDSDGERVVREVILAERTAPIVFFKQMAKHLVGLDRGFLSSCSNVLLTRDPHDMLTSFQVNIDEPTVDDTGFVELNQILDTIVSSGDEPVVVDSDLLLDDPTGVLTVLCERLAVPFDPAMLSWPAGPKPEDGAWAAAWYDSVHRSTGWEPRRRKDDRLRPAAQATFEAVMPLYERLLPYRITTSPDSSG